MIFSIVNILAILGLLAVTYMYMRHTKRMADIMAQEFELRTAPFIVGEGEQVPCEFPAGAIGAKIFKPKITNIGFQPVRIVRIVLAWWYKKSPSQVYPKLTNIDCFLKINDPKEFRIPFDKGDMIKDEESKNLDFPQLRRLSSGKIYAVYIDKNGNERKTMDLYTLENL